MMVLIKEVKVHKHVDQVLATLKISVLLLPILFAVTYLCFYLFIVFSRIGYPFDLEWMEGGMVEHVARILLGMPIYVKPSLEFTPFVYGPFYFYVSAIIAKFIGIGYLPLRLVSFLSSIGIFIVIYLFVLQESKRHTAALISLGLFAATFKVSGAWFDIGRVDSLFMFLLITGIYLLRNESSRKDLVAASLLFSLAAFTKQTTLIIIAPILLFYLVFGRSKFKIVTSLTMITILVCTLSFNYFSQGWFNYYLYELPSQHKFELSAYKLFWTVDMAPLTIALLFSVSLIYLLFKKDAKLGWYYLSLLVGMVLGGWFSRLHTGGDINVLIPSFAAISIITGIGYNHYLRILDRPIGRRKLTIAGSTLICGIMCYQFILLYYNPLVEIPDRASRQAGYKLLAQLKNTPGEVLLSSRPYMLTQIGKTSSAHSYAMSDIFNGTDEKLKADLSDEIHSAILQKKYAVIFFDDQTVITSDILKYYKIRYNVFPQGDTTFFPVTGYPNRPETVLTPR